MQIHKLTFIELTTPIKELKKVSCVECEMPIDDHDNFFKVTDVDEDKFIFCSTDCLDVHIP